MDKKLQKIHYAAAITFYPYGWAGFLTGFVVVMLTIIVTINQDFLYENPVSYIAGFCISILILIISHREKTWFERTIIALDRKNKDPFSKKLGIPIFEKHPLTDKSVGRNVGIAIYLLIYSLVHQSYYLPDFIPFIVLFVLMIIFSSLNADILKQIYYNQCSEKDEERQFIKECLTVDDSISGNHAF